jgi:glycerophosphoryl diester phosphodiesterase
LRKPFIIGHRGVPSLEDENTLESAKHAVALGADIVENDIYLTKDQHLVVMHDATVDRTTRSTGKIEEMSLAQVQQLKSKNKAYPIPTLAEYFTTFKHNPNFVLMIEMKSANPALVAKMQDEIKSTKLKIKSSRPHLMQIKLRVHSHNCLRYHEGYWLEACPIAAIL